MCIRITSKHINFASKGAKEAFSSCLGKYLFMAFWVLFVRRLPRRVLWNTCISIKDRILTDDYTFSILDSFKSQSIKKKQNLIIHIQFPVKNFVVNDG